MTNSEIEFEKGDSYGSIQLSGDGELICTFHADGRFEVGPEWQGPDHAASKLLKALGAQFGALARVVRQGTIDEILELLATFEREEVQSTDHEPRPHVVGMVRDLEKRIRDIRDRTAERGKA